MLDHGQLGSPTPAVAFSPTASRRTPTFEHTADTVTVNVSEHASATSNSQQPVSVDELGQGLSEALSVTPLNSEEGEEPQIRSQAASSVTNSKPTSPLPLHEKSDYDIDPVESMRPALATVSVAAVPPHPSPLSSPSDLAAQPHSHPKLAGLRSSSSLASQVQSIIQPSSPPILANPKCSGYFVEPV